ncbi:hypothetical protein, partial [Pseudomonas sp. HMSC75E02]|uniref:hypothetical protein n=1 Tax=Pseudomonas sp. HMSC75E02 TaxID=1608908 RepID=UPI001C452995
ARFAGRARSYEKPCPTFHPAQVLYKNLLAHRKISYDYVTSSILISSTANIPTPNIEQGFNFR